MVHRDQDRDHQGPAGRGRGDGPLPRRRARRGRGRAVPAKHPAGHPRARAQRGTRSTRPAACCAPVPGCSPTGNASASTRRSPTTRTPRSRSRRASNSRSSPIPHPRPCRGEERPPPSAGVSPLGSPSSPPSGGPSPAAALTSSPTSTGPAPSTDPPKRSTAGSSICEAPPWVPRPHQLHPARTPGHRRHLRAYTVFCDEPLYRVRCLLLRVAKHQVPRFRSFAIHWLRLLLPTGITAPPSLCSTLK